MTQNNINTKAMTQNDTNTDMTLQNVTNIDLTVQNTTNIVMSINVLFGLYVSIRCAAVRVCAYALMHIVAIAIGCPISYDMPNALCSKDANTTKEEST